MTTTPPDVPRSPWAFVAIVGAASLVVAWGVRRAGGLAQAVTARAADAAGGALDYLAGDELPDELPDETEYAEAPDEAPDADTADADEREPYGSQW